MSKPMVKLRRSAALRLEPKKNSPTWDNWVEWCAEQTRPLAADLFAGGGGLSLGLENAGFRVAFAVDHDSWSVETHAANHHGLSVEMDLSKRSNENKIINLLRQANISLIAGGPPCQPFSQAGRSAIKRLIEEGRRDAHDLRRDLWQVWLRIVRSVQPPAVMLENVPEMALGDELGVIRYIVDALESDGYETYLDIVEAPDLGVPQHRKRLILVALKDAEVFHWPDPVKRVNVWQAIGDLPALGDDFGETVLPYGRPKTDFQERARKGVKAPDKHLVYDHETRAVRDDDRMIFEMMDEKTRYGDLPEELRRYRDDSFHDKYKRNGKTELARSITAHIAKDGYWYIHPVEHRTFTVRESARIQTFPDWYRFAGNRSHAWRQIGNAVPPLLGERIGRQIHAALGYRKPDKGRPKVTGQHSPAIHFPSVELDEMRDALDAWAKRDKVVAPWRHVCDPWSALVSSVLVQQKVDDGTIDLALWHFETPELLTREALNEVCLPPGVKKSLRRLLPATDAWRNSDDEDWWTAAKLTSSEAARFDLLALEEPLLVTTQGPLRLAARVTGRPLDKIDRLTDGRLALARLVGGGNHAAARMAALLAASATVCTLKEPACGTCPFSGLCDQAEKQLASLP